jgi:ABC-type glycerol-3-phosphate transport system permease component
MAAPRHHGRRLGADADPVLLGPEDVAHWREHLRLSARIVPVDPHLFHYVDVWYLIPFPRYLLNSVIVTTMAICGNLLFNTAAGYALTKHFPGRRWVVLLLLSCMLIPFQATIIPPI